MGFWDGYSCGPKGKKGKKKERVSLDNVRSANVCCRAPAGVSSERKITHRLWKGAQISILANKIEIQWWPNITVKESNLTIHYTFLFSRY